MQIITLTPYQNAITGYGPNETVLVLCDASISAFSIDLPDVEGIENNTFIFKKTDSTLNKITLTAKYGQMVDGNSTIEIDTLNESFTLSASSSSYYVTGYYAG